MTIGSFRGFLRHLGDTGRLGVAAEGVALAFTLAAIAKRRDGERAVWFPRPGGHPVPVVAGLAANRAWLAEAMGVAVDDLPRRYQAAVDGPLPWRETGDAPCQEVVHERPDLGRLMPIPVHNEHDSGPYITAGLVIARNPRTGAQNVSINRLQLSGPDRLGILILPRHLHRFYDAAEAAGEALPIAIVVGVDPLTLLASQAVLPLDADELEVAGALAGRPLAVTRCLTSEVRVPAEAEFVIEGRLLPGERASEGPFGEFPQYYGPAGDRQVVAVDRVTHRRDPIFHTIVPAGLEHLLLGGIAREASILAHLRRSFPSVVNVHLAQGGVCRYHLVVQIEKRWEGEPKSILMGALAAHPDVKRAVVVDRDVDIFDPNKVEWALATRFQPDRDLFVVPGVQGSRLDPSAADGITAKWGLDATMPVAREGLDFVPVHVPGEDDPRLDEGLVPAPAALLARLGSG